MTENQSTVNTANRLLYTLGAERDRYRAALKAITKVGHGNSWAYEDDPWEWIDAVEKIVADALASPKE